MLTQAREFIATLREGLVAAAVITVLVFPVQAGQWLKSRGVKEFNFFGVMTVDMSKFDTQRDLANTLQRMSQDPGVPSATRQRLAGLAAELAAAMAEQVPAIQRAEPGAVATAGWMYVGRLDPQRTGWQHGATLRAEWPLRPGQVVALNQAAPLHADSAPASRAVARIQSALPAGAFVTVRKVDDSQAVAPSPENGAEDEPGFYVWALVEAAGDAGGVRTASAR